VSEVSLKSAKGRDAPLVSGQENTRALHTMSIGLACCLGEIYTANDISFSENMIKRITGQTSVAISRGTP
jgi:hypothetical protein